MSKAAKSLRLAEWRTWRPWFGKVAKSTLYKLLFLLKAAKGAKKMAYARACVGTRKIIDLY